MSGSDQKPTSIVEGCLSAQQRTRLSAGSTLAKCQIWVV